MMQRIFLDWKKPALEAAADFFMKRFNESGDLDLSRVLAVVPGARAGRRLLEILVDRAAADGLVLDPPEIVTAGALPERLYEEKLPIAGDLVQDLAWGRALREVPPAALEALSLILPAEENHAAWLDLSHLLASLHRELAAEGLDFAGIRERAASLEGFRDEARWQALALLQKQYLAVLHGLSLWDRQTARRFAVDHGECFTDRQIVLCAAADLNRVQRRMLDGVAARITALVFAPERLADRFDEYGCLRPAAWRDARVELDGHRISAAEDPAGQVSEVLRILASLEEKYAADEIVIGVPDEEVVPFLRRGLAGAGVECRFGAGRPISSTSPYRALEAAAEYLETGRYAPFAALLRHPAVERFLDETGPQDDRLAEWDAFYKDHLPYRLAAGSRLPASFRRVTGLLAPLEGGPRPPADWNKPVAEFLTALFGRAPLDPRVKEDHEVIEACEALGDLLAEHERIPEVLAPRLSGAGALRLLLGRARRATVPPEPGPDRVEMLGWLELLLDDAPVCLVTGMQDGIVPSSRNGDLFLPNRLRSALGIEDNARRYARDAYALSAIAATRVLHCIAGRRRAGNDPLHPSRLFFACPPEEAAARALLFFGDATSPLPPSADEKSDPREGGPIPQPKPLREKVVSMRVTEFRDYLACPYRYYLRHRLGLEALDDAAEEMDARVFGLLVHEVLADFGRSETAASTDPDRIRAHLSEALNRIAARSFDRHALAAVRVQIEQARLRLDAFARWQAEWAAAGWRIRHVEKTPDKGREPALAVDGEPMVLRGRIDRIDRNEQSGQWALLDYKTSSAAKSPEETHVSKDGWKDLQLPLYRRLAASMGIEGEIRLGCVNLPKSLEAKDCGAVLAEWTDEDLAGADRAAEEVVRKVRQEIFWPPSDSAGPLFPEFSAICQDRRFAIRTGAETGDEEEGA